MTAGESVGIVVGASQYQQTRYRPCHSLTYRSETRRPEPSLTNSQTATECFCSCRRAARRTGRSRPNLVYFNEVDKGGHFAARHSVRRARPAAARHALSAPVSRSVATRARRNAPAKRAARVANAAAIAPHANRCAARMRPSTHFQFGSCFN